jgi:hypothetical protein
MIKKLVIFITTLALSTGLLMAHGEPLLGTVTAVSKDVVTIKDTNNKEVQVMVDTKTKYMMGTKAVKLADIKVGEKVSIDAQMDTKMKMYVAESVTVAAAKAAGSAATAKATESAPKAATKAPAKK